MLQLLPHVAFVVSDADPSVSGRVCVACSYDGWFSAEESKKRTGWSMTDELYRKYLHILKEPDKHNADERRRVKENKFVLFHGELAQ